MKLKSLFLGMLAAAVFVGCNNENVVGGDPDENPILGGESTTATFDLRFYQAPQTFAHIPENEQTPAGDAALFIYKADGTPEAMIYANNAEWTDDDSNGNGGPDYGNLSTARKITVKCKSGDKLIYLAANLGDQLLIDHNYAGLAHTEANSWLGQDWSLTPGITMPNLNKAVWSLGATTFQIGAPVLTNTPGVADGVILALANAGNPGAAGASVVQTAATPAYLLSNWGDGAYPVNEGGDNAYNSTVKFNLKPNIEALVSRATTPDASNANGKNALLINVQRSLAKVSVEIQPGATGPNAAGGGSNTGTVFFAPSDKWALGNINMSEYPFQKFSGNSVQGTLFNETTPIWPAVSNQNWVAKLDNQRWVPTGLSYADGGLDVMQVRNRINTGYTPNQLFGSGNRVMATENNHDSTWNHYSSFVVFGAVYTPRTYVTGVSNVGNVTMSPVNAAGTALDYATLGIDTMYYVQSYGDSGMFFLGSTALQQYIAWSVLKLPATVDPLTDTDVDSVLNVMRTSAHDDVQADLQAYYRGNCFYRVWIRDADGTTAQNKILVRRNHIYAISVLRFKGPGIGDPDDIIDPDEEKPEPIEEADTYVTASIQIVPWHRVDQIVEPVL
ncbi:MAG: fimbria major subunit [Tannerella sp.]|jgi:hypothetical protein|nr:fimbria major subunit [Tannerella sp.]